MASPISEGIPPSTMPISAHIALTRYAASMDSIIRPVPISPTTPPMPSGRRYIKQGIKLLNRPVTASSAGRYTPMATANTPPLAPGSMAATPIASPFMIRVRKPPPFFCIIDPSARQKRRALSENSFTALFYQNGDAFAPCRRNLTNGSFIRRETIQLHQKIRFAANFQLPLGGMSEGLT